MLEHEELVTTNLHVACYTVADAAARTTLAAALAADQVGLLVYQEDTDHLYVCSGAATLVDLGTTVTLEDHDHTGDTGDGAQLEADLAMVPATFCMHRAITASRGKTCEIMITLVTRAMGGSSRRMRHCFRQA